jgi:hypothetical protein
MKIINLKIVAAVSTIITVAQGVRAVVVAGQSG